MAAIIKTHPEFYVYRKPGLPARLTEHRWLRGSREVMMAMCLGTRGGTSTVKMPSALPVLPVCLAHRSFHKLSLTIAVSQATLSWDPEGASQRPTLWSFCLWVGEGSQPRTRKAELLSVFHFSCFTPGYSNNVLCFFCCCSNLFIASFPCVPTNVLDVTDAKLMLVYGLPWWRSG